MKAPVAPLPLPLNRSAQQMPQIFKWLSYLTFQKYSCELLIVTEFHGLDFSCSELLFPSALAKIKSEKSELGAASKP